MIRSAITWSMVEAGSPASSATRSRSAGSNSISPAMARAVIAATWLFSPAKSASSSMHSCPMTVESMSVTSSRFLRPVTGCTTTSIGALPIVASSFARGTSM